MNQFCTRGCREQTLAFFTNIISFVINGGTFNGAEGKPAVQLSDEVKEKNAAKITAGKFSAEPDSELVKSDMTAELVRNGETTYLIGQSTVNAALAEAQKGDVLTVKTAAEDAELVDVPEGVTIKNNTGADMTINGVTVAAGAEVIVKDNSGTDGNGDSNQGDKPAPSEPDKAEETPETGDDTMIMGFAVMMLASLGLGGVLVATRRTCRK